MCEPACITYTGGVGFKVAAGKMDEARAVAARTYHAAVELFAMLCKEYDLNPLGDGVILSHAEGYARGIASNHGDPEHLWRGLGLGYTMDGFRKDVKKAMDGSGVSTGNGKAVYPDSNVKGDKVQVKISNLNIRKGPGDELWQNWKIYGCRCIYNC